METMCPMYFGVSCAFFAVRLLREEDGKGCELHEKIFRGGAQLLGLLVWRIQKGMREENVNLLQKLNSAELKIQQLKKVRHEDAKANEKVVGIFASQEQNWLYERKKLRLQMRALMKELRVTEERNSHSLSAMNARVDEMELAVQSKNKVIEEMEEKLKELSEDKEKSEKEFQELKENAKKEAQEHTSELWKQKSAFIELVSNQRQLEADLCRALKQVDGKERELKMVREQKEESVLLVQKLSLELVKMRKDLDQNENLLSIMFRKAKLDATEKQMLLKEKKLSNYRKTQVDSESRHGRHTLRSMFASESKIGQVNKGRSQMVIEYPFKEAIKNFEEVFDVNDPNTSVEKEEIGIAPWIPLEPEKNMLALEKGRNLEVDSYMEQMRLKDEEVGDLNWRLLGMELESKRLRAYIDGLNRDVSHLRRDNRKLEAILSQRQEESKSLTKQLSLQLRRLGGQKNSSRSSSKVNGPDRLPIEELAEMTHLKEAGQESDTNRDKEVLSTDEFKTEEDLSFVSAKRDFEEGTEASTARPEEEEGRSRVDINSAEQSAPLLLISSKAHTLARRTDLHALGVSYKIKRLEQQLLMLERIREKQIMRDKMGKENKEKTASVLLISLLHKQVQRYQALQEKTDDLSGRVCESNDDEEEEAGEANPKRVNKAVMEHLLEETFQLQRYMVATGQKLIEIQKKITCSLITIFGEVDDSLYSFDMERFAESIKTLFQEVQRGLEVRISRIIGILEGTLACEGMIHMKGCISKTNTQKGIKHGASSRYQ